MKKVTITLNQDQIQTVLKALNYVGDKYFDQVEQVQKLDPENHCIRLLDKANEHISLAKEINNQTK